LFPPTKNPRMMGKNNNARIFFLILSLLVSFGNFVVVAEDVQVADDLSPPVPQPNDVYGTVYGCAQGLLNDDINGDGTVRMDEYLQFVNDIGALLCYSPKSELDFSLRTNFVSISCLCIEREGFGPNCCIESNAAIYTEGAADPADRTEDEDTYLRAACLLTEAMWGPSQCVPEEPTLDDPVAGFVGQTRVEDKGLTDRAKQLIALLVLMLLLLCCLCCICCCCGRRKDSKGDETWEKTVTEEIYVYGPDGNEIPRENFPKDGDRDDVERALLIPDPISDPYEEEEVMEPPQQDPVSQVESRNMAVPQTDDISDNEPSSPKRRKIASSSVKDEDDEDKNRGLRGEGGLPDDKDKDGMNLRPVEVLPGAPPGDYDYPARQIYENKDKDDDSAQELEHYVPDGGVNIPERPEKEPIEMPKPTWERLKKKVPSPIDLRKRRRQMGLGDGEVWDALEDYDEEEQQAGRQEKIDWVVEAAIEAFTKADEDGSLIREESDDEEDEEEDDDDDDEEEKFEQEE